MVRTAGQIVLGIIAFLCTLGYVVRREGPIPDAIPICFTLAVGFLTLASGVTSGEDSRPADDRAAADDCRS
jgi:hypothetical protein